jgi:dTDP-glucose pyrophosphorylase/CBS domain-containing protein
VHPELTEILVAPETTIVEALRVLDETGGKILFVADADGVLEGVLTDGDIRRHILAGRGLDAEVRQAMNVTPVWIGADASDEEMRVELASRRVHCMPVLGEDRRVVEAVWWADLFGSPGMPRRPAGVPVAIMAGGKGTRLEPFTRILPKPLMPVGDQPVLQLIMDRFHEQGCTRFLVSLNFKASLIRAYFSDEQLPYEVEFFDEDMPLGTAGSLALMSGALDRTFILANCDTIVDIEYADLIDHHRSQGNIITIVASMKHIVLPYGVCQLGEGGILDALQEKPRFDLLVSTGVYVMEPEVLAAIGKDGPTDATDVIRGVLDSGRRVGVFPIPDRAWLDVGQLEELQNALDRLGIR